MGECQWLTLPELMCTHGTSSTWPSLRPLTSMHNMREILPLGHLRFVSLALSQLVRLEGVSCGRLYMGTSICVHVSHLSGKCYSHHSTELSPQPKGRNYRQRKRKRGFRVTHGEPWGQQECHPHQCPESSGIMPIQGHLPQGPRDLCSGTKLFFEVMLLSGMAWCPDNWKARRYILKSRLMGKILEEEMSAFRYQWKWKNLKNSKGERKCILVIMGLERAEAGWMLYWIWTSLC